MVSGSEVGGQKTKNEPRSGEKMQMPQLGNFFPRKEKKREYQKLEKLHNLEWKAFAMGAYMLTLSGLVVDVGSRDHVHTELR